MSDNPWLAPYDPMSACVDCLLLIANGEIPDERPDLVDVVTQRWGGFWLALGCPETCCPRDDDGGKQPWFSWSGWFSWEPCGVCGSPLGGEREHVTPFKIH